LARALGVQPSAINHIEAGRVLPGAARLRTLAAVLRVDPKQVVP
jgi:transcriptional regulator with XRE-family HTH domain